MATPFVIFAPEQERKRLRDNGVLPSGFFGDIDHRGEDGVPFCFWPYKLDYAAGDELAKRVREHPVHIPEFFGMKATADVETRNLATDRVVKVLKSVAVHIVFLDDGDGGGRGEEYVSFGSFSELTRWSANLNEVLKVAFAQNHMLAAPENILVLVARSSSVKVSESELAAFESQVGDGRTFRCCYFLDHHLAIGGGSDFVPSRDVWDIMVARLLHAFYLSCDGHCDGAISELWKVPGIKVWRASECVFAIDDRTSEATRRWVRSWVYNSICNRMGQVKENGDVLGKMDSSEMPEGGIAPEVVSWNDAEYWLGVDPSQYKRIIEDPRRRELSMSATSVFLAQEHSRLRLDDGDEMAKEIFGSVHSDAGNVQPSRVAVDASIRHRLEELKTCDPETEWKRVSELNRSRQKMIDDMNSGDEFNVIRRHYIGWTLGFAVVVSVVSCYGIFAYLLLSKVLGAGIFYSLLAGGAISVGALAMLSIMLIAHNRAGQRSVRAICDYCREIDRITAKRDECVRSSVYKGMRRHMLFNQLSTGARIKSLLLRLFTMMETELQGSDMIDERRESTPTAQESELRARFRAASRHQVTFVPGRTAFEKRKIDEIVKDMWIGRRMGDDFAQLWKRLCGNDMRTVGHFPAAMFIPALRRFSSDIVGKVYAEAIDRSIDAGSQTTIDVFKGWMGGIAAQNYYTGFSAEFNASIVDTNRRCQLLFYLPRLREIVDRAANGAALRFRPYTADQILVANGTMAFAYEEAVVGMSVGADSGLLELVEAREANLA